MKKKITMRHRSTWANTLIALALWNEAQLCFLNYTFRISWRRKKRAHTHTSVRERLIKSSIFRLCARTGPYRTVEWKKECERKDQTTTTTTTMKTSGKWMVMMNNERWLKNQRQKCCNLVQTAIDFLLECRCSPFVRSFARPIFFNFWWEKRNGQ